MSSGTISGVLPLKVYGRRYIDDFARCHILFTSLATFAARDLFADIFIVVPARERRFAEALRDEWPSLPLSVVSEEDILPDIRPHPKVGSWYRQQVIKLSAANLSQTEFFLTFDSDVLLCKPMGAADILRDGKALLQAEQRQVHAKWWTSSATLLGVPLDLSAPGMSVTPAILSRSICRRLFEHLEERYNQSWTAALLERVPVSWENWTEYSLYYLTAEYYGLLDHYHFPPAAAPGMRLMCLSNVWGAQDFDNWKMEACFSPDEPGYFAIIQSKTKIPLATICHRIEAHLPVTKSLTPSAAHRVHSAWEDLRKIGGTLAYAMKNGG